jgi:hypothetical protein
MCVESWKNAGMNTTPEIPTALVTRRRFFALRAAPKLFAIRLVMTGLAATGLAALVGLSLAPVARTQEKTQAESKLTPMNQPPAPTAGYRAEFLSELGYFEQRYTRLAEAIPAEKYSWRPAEGVRSIGEVFAHTTGANVLINRSLEAPLKPGVTYDTDSGTVMKNLMAIANDKEKVIQELKNSFAALRTTVLMLGDGDGDKPQKMFGKDTTLRGSFFLVTGTWGEHLGGLIADARMNGIVPPWTADAAKKEKPADKPKP